jgi:chromosome segregation protein
LREGWGLRLKRLEIHGFKSFADKTVLDFGSGLTAVVGPNGSGKSNFVDAVRWVFGEQNPRLMRAQRMEDLIFSGSAHRRPLSLADVTAVLDNSDGTLGIDFTEVAITRRMSRDGASEYAINRVPCRLKDITDLLSDTGAGKESYSIIGQGKIDEALSSRPEDRRGLFEEAAGIVKYRNRKREALKKLDETSEGQVRISDIIAEVGSRAPALEAEALRAQKHEELQQSLAILEIGREIHRAEALSRELDERRAEVSGLQQRSDKERARLGELDAEYTSVSLSLSAAEEQIEGLATRAADATQAQERAESRSGLLRDEASTLQAQIAASKEAHAGAEESFAALEAAMAAHQAEMAALSAAAIEAYSGVAKATGRVAATEEAWRDVSSKLQTQRRALVEHSSNASRLRSTAFAEASLARNTYLDALRVEDERKAAAQEMGRLQLASADLQREASARRAELDSARTRLAVTSAEVQRLRRESSDLEKEMDGSRRKAAAANGKLSSLRESRQRFEGYQDGPRKVLALASSGRLPGIVGPVAGVLKVEPGYEKALDAALGGAVQYIVAESWEKAEKAIEMLKESRSGRATFLPLDTIREASLTTRERQALASVGSGVPAADLIRCDPVYRPVVAHLLGRCVVMPDLPAAVRLGRLAGFGLRIATRDGDLVSPGGSITGGERRGRPGLFGQQAELDRAEREALDFAEEAACAEQRYQEAASQLREREDRRLEDASLTRALEQECAALEGQMEALASTGQSLQRKVAGLESRASSLYDESFAHAAAAKSACAEALEEEDRLRGAEAAARELEACAEAADEERSAAQADLGQAREELARARQAEVAAARRLADAGSERQRLAASLDGRLREIAALQSRLDEVGRQVAEAVRELELVRSIRVDAQRRFEEKRSERESLSTRLLAIERSIRSTSRSLDNITLRMIEQAREETRLSTSLSLLDEGLRSRFSVSLAVARMGYAALDAACEPRIAELREEISSLGEVNPAAPAELVRMKQRLSFLESQNQDLDKAQAQLRQIINDMDQKMSATFTSSFAKVRDNFKQVFRELFGGGEADLWLTDPSNVLESGIEISARPPGRSSQVLTLLSGGERCLVAIALLFAMQRLNPSPFCVLDEIEAPLDEANVERFCVFLKGLASRSQYILITHQKRTMEISDVLYGLTMQETGVSATLSVKLADVFA